MSDKTIELKALEECLVKSLDQYSHTLETAQRRQKDQSTWRREMLDVILDEWDRHDEYVHSTYWHFYWFLGKNC